MASWRSNVHVNRVVVMLLVQVDALVVVVFMGVGTCARVRGASECLFVCDVWMVA